MMTAARRSENTVVSVAVAFVVLVTGSCASPATEAPAAPTLAVHVRFTALWWSEAQMEGLNPNNPPPKNTEVELTRWEYTDPVGVPHPDVVNILVTVENRGTTSASDLMVTTGGKWNIGPLEDESRSEWGETVVLGKADRLQVPATSRQTIRVPVNLKQTMDSLRRQDRWPYALRVDVSVAQPGVAELLARTQVDFPIRPGN